MQIKSVKVRSRINVCVDVPVGKMGVGKYESFPFLLSSCLYIQLHSHTSHYENDESAHCGDMTKITSHWKDFNVNNNSVLILDHFSACVMYTYLSV